MGAQLSRVSGQMGIARVRLVGRRGVEVGVERHLGVDHHPAPTHEVDHQVGPPGAVVEAHLLVEVAPVDQPGELHRAAQVQLAPATADLRLAQRRRQGPGLPLQRGHVLVELALPQRSLPVEVVHLVAQPVEALHHLGLLDQPGGVRRPGTRPEHADHAAEAEPGDEGGQHRDVSMLQHERDRPTVVEVEACERSTTSVAV